MATDTPDPAVELVALLASAGGLGPLSIVLGDLPAEFPAAVVVQQHLGGHSSVLPGILRGRTPHRVDWARDGQSVAPGRVLVCPPGVHMTLRSNGTCSLRTVQEPGEHRFDVLMASLAASYGARALAVVLSGTGRDGAEGTVAMKRAGATVIAQSPATAQYASMPIAAARAGADLVLPIYEIGRALVDIVEGVPLPRPCGEPHETDWAATSLGPPMERPEQETDRHTNGAEREPMETGEATTAHRDRHQNPPTQISRDPNSPAARAEAARLRVDELRRRRQDLAAGRGATAQTVTVARRRAEESLRRARQAHQSAEHAAGRPAD
jgi:two-component system, chemotaxis family, protein-glutamate methylesterase/glutaminase